MFFWSFLVRIRNFPMIFCPFQARILESTMFFWIFQVRISESSMIFFAWLLEIAGKADLCFLSTMELLERMFAASTLQRVGDHFGSSITAQQSCWINYGTDGSALSNDSGMALLSLTYSILETDLFLNFVHWSGLWKWIVFVFLTTLDLSVLCRISWLKLWPIILQAYELLMKHNASILGAYRGGKYVLVLNEHTPMMSLPPCLEPGTC